MLMANATVFIRFQGKIVVWICAQNFALGMENAQTKAVDALVITPGKTVQYQCAQT